MLNILLDIAPLPHEVIDRTPRVVVDTIDTMIPPVQQMTDPLQPGGGSNIGLIIGAIAAALLALGIIIFTKVSHP